MMHQQPIKSVLFGGSCDHVTEPLAETSACYLTTQRVLLSRTALNPMPFVILLNNGRWPAKKPSLYVNDCVLTFVGVVTGFDFTEIPACQMQMLDMLIKALTRMKLTHVDKGLSAARMESLSGAEKKFVFEHCVCLKNQLAAINIYNT
ncbi:hypothetical protein HELRODRAFT_164598 [Helobdella robusta]|uniref:Uncharacterized protein n=1 Tax=Helobdella robusta TaxID=6412 RepID=T1EVM2_HELRO|nr:hypothetical protein HELRODRAFT_164598 [Helobdella robusta]ESN94711.1 hypothetical protein HELRODRAFT_164598 [Helobdella robusta]